MTDQKLRPDYICCIRRTHVISAHLSWCGRELGPEWAFQGLDHAAENAAQEGRLVACEKCVDAAFGVFEADE